MARRSSKHSREQQLRFNDFGGGLNLSANRENIQDNELSQAENWEYSYPTGKLKIREGLTLTKNVGVDIDTLFYADNLDIFLFSSGTTIYKYAGGNVTNLGTLSGTAVPTFALWDAKILIASGDTLQSYDNATLEDTGSPYADIVFTRAGRVVIARSGYDRLIYSGVGDETNWGSGTDSDMVEIDIGYKDGGDIIAVVPMATDVVVFKSSGSIFRLVSEYPNWAVYEITRSQAVLTKFATVQSGNNAFFLAPTGLMSLNAVQDYGNVKTSEEGYKINSAIAELIDTGARVWEVPSKGQIWVRPEASVYIWVYHTINRAWTKFKMPGVVTAVTSLDDGTNYVSIGQVIYSISGNTDNGSDIVAFLRLKKFTSANDYMVKKINASFIKHTNIVGNISTGLLSLNFSSDISGDIAFEDIDIAYSDTDALVTVDENRMELRASYRVGYIEPTIQISSGDMTLKEIILNVVEV